tara:strand:- start:198 stop:371 length:174 start_codon:yes stop_codon:yes gene_type:complete
MNVIVYLVVGGIVVSVFHMIPQKFLVLIIIIMSYGVDINESIVRGVLHVKEHLVVVV